MLFQDYYFRKLNEWHGMDDESGSPKYQGQRIGSSSKAQDSTFYISVIQDHIESIGKANTIKEG